MKIKFICHKLVVGHGGIETVLVEVANYLSRFFDVSIVLVNMPHDKQWLSKFSKDVTVVLPKYQNK
ncbi:MAG: UDP-D-galactose--(glucosyl)lipopolysaccharide-1,6-D-galactosyltransferase, partial [Lactobacillus sp.]|nr:UDP-D-galactose--(glucosyl)lipopolysaccharide-1,6-D-galactosyltransferase [Lactobacillus sp.]